MQYHFTICKDCLETTMGKCEICDKNTDYTVLDDGRCNYCSKTCVHSHYICKKCVENSKAINKNNPKKKMEILKISHDKIYKVQVY
jgi:hypothetical protein